MTRAEQLRVVVPVEYRGFRHAECAYARGFLAGEIANAGGVALRVYKYPVPQRAYEHGFTDAQALKRRAPVSQSAVS